MALILHQPLILASQSPRRQELLKMIGLPFKHYTPGRFKEFTSEDYSDPEELVKQNARGKAEEAAEKHPTGLILGVDTVVTLGKEILGKPENKRHALSMLKALQGKTHTVWTGVMVLNAKEERRTSFQDKTQVDLLLMTEEQMEAYIETGEPMDKAGAYTIQGLGSIYIRGIRGDFFNVVGLPLWHLVKVLEEIQIPHERND